MPDGFSRRKFMQTSAIAAGGLLSPSSKAIMLEPHAQSTPTRPVGANDRLRFGIIGVGMEGSGVLSSALSIPGAECVAAADLYDGRHTLAKEITGNPTLFTTRHYQELLERKDIDCILAAVPDFWHKQVVADACNAGKDIYCEKPMSHSIAEGFAMVQAAQSNKRIVQIGAQRVSSVLCAKAREMYLGGAIGEVTSVELTLGRNSPTGAWEYPPPPDLSPENLAWDVWLKDTPKIAFNPERFARWRCWRDYGTGVAVDSAGEALRQLSATTFDCMVMDFNLPDYSGYDLLAKMAQQEDVAFPPVIVYTGRALSTDEEQRLRRYSKSIIIKDARSPERLLDEVTLFLHQVESKLPPERQQMLKTARSRESSLHGRRVLVVEDDVRNIFALSSVLEPQGATVEIARNGIEALEVLARSMSSAAGAVDMVLMDIMMPEMDGLTAMREIRKRPEMKHIPIIALTAKAMRDDQEKCLSAGANDYIAKPLDVEKLLSLVRVWMPK